MEEIEMELEEPATDTAAVEERETREEAQVNW